MKQLSWLLSGILVATVLMISSCSKDSSTEPTDQKPSLTFQVGSGYISSDATVPVKSELTFGIRAMSNSSSGAKLTEMIFTRTFNSSTQTYDTTFSSSTFNIDLSTTASQQVGTETFIFTLKDKNGQVNSLTVVITTTPLTGPINAFEMKILGAQGSTTGSSFASIDGTVYNLADAKANAAKIDWLYYYGASDMASIAAPNDAHAAEVFNNATNGLQTWSKLNATKFKLITDNIDFSTITDDAIIVAQCASGVTQSRITGLTVGKLLAFTTESGKNGIMKVESISGTDAGTMTISVKVQK